MKKIIYTLCLLLTSSLMAGANGSIFEQKITNSKGESVSLEQYRGSSILIVNIATRCGYTPQLDDLEKLYNKYQDKKLVIIGVPSNDFGSQTPEKGEDIAKFCKLKYGVTFPLTKKIIVKGDNKTSFIKYVISSFDSKEISWNFEKFLFDKDGKPVQRFLSNEKPLDSSLENAIIKTTK